MDIRNRFGFTLIELIVVIGIVAIMAAATLATLNPFGQFQKGADARRKSDLSQVQKALEIYYQDKGGYPTNDASFRIVNGGVSVDWGSSWQPYINVLPKDPSSSNKYIYYSPNGQTYYLYVNLSRGVKDSQSCTGGLACPNVPAGASCGSSAPCNFGVTSPNVTP